MLPEGKVVNPQSGAQAPKNSRPEMVCSLCPSSAQPPPPQPVILSFIMASSPTVKPVQIRNQAAANALLERHRLCPGTFGVPLGRLEVIEGNRPIDSAHVDELRRNMEGRIDVNRAPCQTVFFPKAGAQMTLEQARELFSTLRETNKAAIEQDELGWLFEVFDVSVV